MPTRHELWCWFFGIVIGGAAAGSIVWAIQAPPPEWYHVEHIAVWFVATFSGLLVAVTLLLVCLHIDGVDGERNGEHPNKNPAGPRFDKLVWLFAKHYDAYDKRRSQTKGYSATDHHVVSAKGRARSSLASSLSVWNSLRQPFPMIPEQARGDSQQRNTYRDHENVFAPNNEDGTEKARNDHGCNHDSSGRPSALDSGGIR